MSNPSAVLVARSSRSGNNLSAALSSPTETHAAAAGVFRSSSTPPWLLDSEMDGGSDESELDLDGDSNAAVELDETFTERARFPGTVKVVVEKTIFLVHREVLVFASPFFEAALSGSWSETGRLGRPHSVSSVITISQPPLKPNAGSIADIPTEMTFAPMDPDRHNRTNLADEAEPDNLLEGFDPFSDIESETGIFDCDPSAKEKARVASLEKLQKGCRTSASSRKGKGKSVGSRKQPDALVTLKEERPSIFQDFLKYVYPHLECTITWNNVEGLMNISNKLLVPSLQKACSNFLITHAAGNPVKAMRIAELFEEEELYREASRFVLDNPDGWSDTTTLSQETQLKLERRRTWFLERVLKLGLTNIGKEYQCCSTCPDLVNCARLLDEKWKQGYQAAMRFGACQPSILWRFMRMLEVSPPLALTHLACQTTAKNFAATIFDRMFSLGMRGSGTDTVAALRGVSGVHARYFLYITLKAGEPKGRAKSRDAL
ncbi:hypothetical protein SISNIDRAFT_476784 [Sistotremastrum niveocremeum HHB9708]|uniref:BTB domain-containing protein n=1 Tax=Sistotremastrum niveocremeum HHB9708 TaxID=1314777 RepID=A0A164ZY19_9AGAM|nr:hypothetical protein SISNIDRAFT_476784 [Sistotremastrum niveocremeum HHB9708]